MAALKHGVFGETKQNCNEYNLGTGASIFLCLIIMLALTIALSCDCAGRGVSVMELFHAVEKASGKKLEYK